MDYYYKEEREDIIMAFKKKTWKDRITEFPTRRTLTKADGSTELVTVARAEGTVSQEGDAFNAANMNDLERRIADAQPVILTGTLAAGETTITFTDNAITTESMLEFFATIPVVPEPDQSFDEATGTLTLTFEAQSEDMGVKVRVS